MMVYALTPFFRRGAAACVLAGMCLANYAQSLTEQEHTPSPSQEGIRTYPLFFILTPKIPAHPSLPRSLSIVTDIFAGWPVFIQHGIGYNWRCAIFYLFGTLVVIEFGIGVARVYRVYFK